MAQKSKIQESAPNPIALLEELTLSSLTAIREAVEKTELLSQTRADLKLSNSRTTSVSRELKELAKVMALYCY